MNINTLLFTVFISMMVISCKSQNSSENKQLVGGPCEGCEAVFEYKTTLSANDTLPGFFENEPKMKVEGTIFQSDGKTPAPDVILYFYHTNRKGLYEKKGDETGWGRRHGMYRGWIKTGADGRYAFYTFRPGAYPGGTEAEHIHLTVKEADKNEYYIDDIVFSDDPLLTDEKKKSLLKRGGSGISDPVKKNEILYVTRDIILGQNVPNYH